MFVVILVVFEIIFLIVLDVIIGDPANPAMGWLTIGIAHVVVYGIIIGLFFRFASKKHKCRVCGEKVHLEYKENIIGEKTVPKIVSREEKIRIEPKYSSDSSKIYEATIPRDVQIMVKELEIQKITKCPKCGDLEYEIIRKEVAMQ